jgi:cation:H+ antiporter
LNALTIAIVLFSLGLILVGAEVFTNAVEWLGRKLEVSEGAVGSVFAAVGTALPETMIPVIAILFGTEAGHEIGIGAILGAPFMLGTLALFITGLAVLICRRRRATGSRMEVDFTVITRDLKFFLLVYTLAIGVSFIPLAFRHFVALFLVLAYVVYVYQTIKKEKPGDTDESIAPLYFARRTARPRLRIILLQVLAALLLVIGGAHLFIGGIEEIAVMLGIPAFVLSLIIAPVATELPEKFNSIIWVRRGKDTLALGNITGAMVFQSSVIPALGIALTDWALTTGALLSALLTLMSTGLVFSQIRIRKYVSPHILLTGGLMYGVFLALVLTGVIR